MGSILQNEKVCFICGQNQVHKHHIFQGYANRKISDKLGFYIYLCPYHHNLGGKNCIHQNTELNLIAKQMCQKEYEKLHSREEFIKQIGKSYL